MGVLICNNCKSFWYKNTVTCKECGSSTLTETADSNKSRIKWTKTDPDNFQFGRQIGDGVYEFKEFDHHSIFPDRVRTLEEAEQMPDNWVQETVNINMYTKEQREDYVSSYYSSLESLKEIYGKEWKWVLAECIFEQESGLY